MNNPPTDEQQAVINAMMRRIRAGELRLVPDVIALFNSRPMRRANDYRIQGWTVIELPL